MFDNMDYIYEVYKEGSFSKAARNLFISQPSLSASVKRVEDKLGYPIFDRSTKPLRLTEVGEKYVETLLAIRKLEKDFSDYINDCGELKAGSLKVGGTNLVSSLVAPGIIKRFSGKHPNITTELREGITEGLQQQLADGELDLVIDYSLPYDEMFDSLKLADEYLVLTVPMSLEVNRGLEKYRLDIEDIKNGTAMTNDVPPVPAEYFRDVPFVMLRKQNDTCKRAMRMFAKAGFEPKRSFEAAQQMTAYHVCRSGMGAAFVSSLLLSGMTPAPDVYYYKLDPEFSARQLCILWKRDRYLTRAMQEFINAAREELE